MDLLAKGLFFPSALHFLLDRLLEGFVHDDLGKGKLLARKEEMDREKDLQEAIKRHRDQRPHLAIEILPFFAWDVELEGKGTEVLFAHLGISARPQDDAKIPKRHDPVIEEPRGHDISDGGREGFQAFEIGREGILFQGDDREEKGLLLALIGADREAAKARDRPA